MFAINEDESIIHPIQSKGLSKKSDVPLGLDLDKLRSRWWIVTIGASSEAPICYVLTLDEVKTLATRDKGGRRAYWLPKKAYMAPKFEEAWDRLEAVD